MLNPTNLDISAFYEKQLSKDKTIFVSINTYDKGSKTSLRITTTGGANAGDFIVEPDQLQAVTDFAHECAAAFEQLVKVNAAFKAEHPQRIA